ncbi:MAG TPA: hypothetical protein VLB44_05065 [Kofleriaceae bacterium]|nr:hypothetical protein [Kofleriaceae bacterium]
MQRVLLILALLGSGCSFAFVSGPPANHQRLAYFDCTTSNVVPVLDTIWTALQTLNLLTAAASNDQKWNDTFNGKPPFSRGVAIPLYAVAAAAGGAGMWFGYTRVSACRSAKGELAMRANPGTAPMPGTWPPPAAMPAASPPVPAAPPAAGAAAPPAAGSAAPPAAGSAAPPAAGSAAPPAAPAPPRDFGSP